MFRALSGVACLFVFAGVAAGETRVDWNPSKDFHQYKTFSVEVNAPIDVSGTADEHNTLATDRLRQAVTRELQARGLERVDTGGDLTIVVSSRESKQTDWVSSGWSYPYDYYPYWGIGYRPWGIGYRPATYWGGWQGGAWAYTYIEGTVRVDVVENKTGDLVFRATHVDEVNKHLDKEANKAVRHAFRKYPIEKFDAD